MLSRSLPVKLSACKLFARLPLSLLPSEALRKRFPRFPLRRTCCNRSVPCCLASSGEALRKLFPRFPLRPACCIAPSQRSFPQAISTVSSPSSTLSRSLPAKLSPSYFHGFLSVQHAVIALTHAVSLPPGEAPRTVSSLAPSQRSSPQAISTVSSPSNML